VYDLFHPARDSRASLAADRRPARPKPRLRSCWARATKLYQQGDVGGALEKFNAAYAAYPSPKLMFNIGQANRDLSRPVEAIEAFQRFLAEATDASPRRLRMRTSR